MCMSQVFAIELLYLFSSIRTVTKGMFKIVCDNGGFSEAIVKESKKGNLEQVIDESV